MRKILFAIVWAYTVLPLATQLHIHADNALGQYNVRHITSSDGLMGNTVRDIKQDADGFLWMAGTGGLARYDGYRFVQFNGFGYAQGLNIPRHIGKLMMTEDNDQMWISTATYNQLCYDLRLGRFVDYTGRNADEQPYRRIVSLKSGVWMWSNTYGVRYVCKQNGKYVTRDYTKESGELTGNRIRRICGDDAGNVWVAADNGLTRIDTKGNAKIILRAEGIMGCYSYGNRVMVYKKPWQTAYIYSSDGRLVRKSSLPSAMGHVSAVRDVITWQNKWIVFTGESVFALDKETGVFTKPAELQMANGAAIGHVGEKWFVSNQSSGSLWILPDKGSVKRLDLLANPTRTRDRNRVFSVTKGHDGRYYIGSYGGGLFVYDDRQGTVAHYTAEDRNPIIFSNYVLYTFTDRSGCVWVSAENGGVSCLTPTDEMAKYYVIDSSKSGDWTNAIVKVEALGGKELRVETMDNIVYNFSLSTLDFDKGKYLGYLVNGNITDRQGRHWMTTRGKGLVIDGQEMEVTANGKNVEMLDYSSIHIDRQGRIWIGTWGKGLLLVESVRGKKVTTRTIVGNQYNENRINQVVMTDGGKMFVATFNGLYVADVSKKNVSSEDFYLYHIGSGNFPADEIYSICPAGDNILWVGTIGGGLVRCDFSKGLRNMTYRSFTKRDGLSNDNIRSLVLDRGGNLWVGTDYGISRVDTNGNYIRRYEFSNQVLSNTFNINSAALLADGRLAFGSMYGLAIIDPALESKAAMKAKPGKALVSDIRINGTSIYDGLDSLLLDSALIRMPEISLSHSQNSLTFFFSSCNYREMTSQAYQYYLEGVDNGWRETTGENRAEYSNLSPGGYVFHLRSVSQNGVGKETVLKVHVRQPWYNTVWAWIIYIIIMCAVAYYLWSNARERLRMHQRLQLEKQVAEFRTEFFTHVTHEFRTPLAIMQNALDKLTVRVGPVQKDIQTAQRGMRRLMRLVNRFLEYRRVQTGKMRLQVESGDIVVFLQDIFMDFRNMAAQKHITMTFTPCTKHLVMLFDHQIVESVTYNLLSNAIKYTPEGGTVTMNLRQQDDGDLLSIIVEDSGPGIKGDQLANLFHPFMEGHVSKGGMGIGLYNSHEMAALHHGSLAYANVQPHGSRFTLMLPTPDSAYAQSEHAAKVATKVTEDNGHYDEVIREMSPNAINSQRVAIIEDDPDMLEQISGEVGVYFNTTLYENGAAALDGIAKEPPSLILCDIMLPDTNGYDIVAKLRAKKELCDIPIIMLTALDDESHQIKGYQVGADDYMVKPCNYHLLIARMMQLITWREKRESERMAIEQSAANASSETTPQPQGAPTVILTSRADKRFREQVEMIVAQNLDDQTLSVDRLAEMMSMGRTKFYGKIKDVFGMSPNKYLMGQRMEAAAHFLEEGRYNVSEVSYKVGFSDPAYFNKCFKAHFGMVPSKYKNQ